MLNCTFSVPPPKRSTGKKKRSGKSPKKLFENFINPYFSFIFSHRIGEQEIIFYFQFSSESLETEAIVFFFFHLVNSITTKQFEREIVFVSMYYFASKMLIGIYLALVRGSNISSEPSIVLKCCFHRRIPLHINPSCTPMKVLRFQSLIKI